MMELIKFLGTWLLLILQATYRSVVWLCNGVNKALKKILEKPEPPKFSIKDDKLAVQAAAAKRLPELTDQLSKVNGDIDKIRSKLASLETDRKEIEAVIRLAGGVLDKPEPKNNKNNNNNQKQKGNNNNQIVNA